jgi:hypothetical protein
MKRTHKAWAPGKHQDRARLQYSGSNVPFFVIDPLGTSLSPAPSARPPSFLLQFSGRSSSLYISHYVAQGRGNLSRTCRPRRDCYWHRGAASVEWPLRPAPRRRDAVQHCKIGERSRRLASSCILLQPPRMLHAPGES